MAAHDLCLSLDLRSRALKWKVFDYGCFSSLEHSSEKSFHMFRIQEQSLGETGFYLILGAHLGREA
jgi:hypothetical protein